MSQFNTSALLEGLPLPSQTPVRLHAGPLTLLLEPGNGFIRHFRWGDRRILNGIYAAVRDRNWGTVQPTLHNLRIDQRPDSFLVTFTATCAAEAIHFVWQGRITGDAGGVVRYKFDGEASTTFLRNRIGFCVLHDADCAGRPCTVEHVDGRTIETLFPRFIAPHQPFKEVRATTHAPPGGPKVEVRMEGDVFEMEDQRNWTDASFKTYCTPLELPFPVEIQAGTRMHQSIEVRCRQTELHALASVSAGTDHNLTVSAGGPFHPLPRLGLGMASHDLTLNEVETRLLRRLQPDHLRCDLRLDRPDWRSQWDRALSEAHAIDCHLHVGLHLDSDRNADHQFATVAELSDRGRVDVWLIFVRGAEATEARWTELARTRLRTATDAAGQPLIAGGTDAYFAELNRNRPAPGSADAINWSITPQVHASDNLSLIETLDAQWQTVVSAREFTDAQLMVSPVTLRPRFNPDSTANPPPLPPDVLPPEVDVRQMSLLGAGWTLGSIASLARGPLLRSLTYYETTGWRGVMEWSGRPRLPHVFVTRPNWVFPLYFVFGLLAGHDECRPLRVGQLDRTELFVRNSATPGRVRWLVASHGCELQELELPDGFRAIRALVLDHANAISAMRNPESLLDGEWQMPADRRVLLEPFALAAFDGEWNGRLPDADPGERPRSVV